MAHTGDLPTKNVLELVAAAKKYRADLTPGRQIRWDSSSGVWRETLQFRPSVLDAMVLEYAWKVGPSYLSAIQAATGWRRRTIFGFLQIMLCGEPLESTPMLEGSLDYWKGIIMGVMVYGKLRRH